MFKAIKRGVRVLVIAGNDKGKHGEVLAKGEDRVLVQGINVRKKHLKRTSQTQAGRIIEMEVPIHISNVCLCDKEGNKLKKKASAAAEEAPAKKKPRKSAKKVKDV